MQHYSSSPTSLSSPPSALSEPGSPSRFLNAGRANIEMDEIIVDPGSAPRFGVMQRQQPPPPPDVPLTAAGLPRKKPGRKPGSTLKPKVAPDGSATNTDQPKQRRPRKPKDPNAPPVQRKRKTAPTEAGNGPMDVEPRSFSGPAANRQPKITELTSMRPIETRPPPVEPMFTQKIPKREVSMQSILNDDPPPKPQPAPPRQMFDPIRGNYDPIRETMVPRDPYGTGSLGSPRAPTQAVNRASASPSIASLVDPTPSHMISPVPSNTSYNNTSAARFQEPTPLPPSPSHPARSAPHQITKPTIMEVKRPPPPPPVAPSSKPDVPRISSFTSMTTVPTTSGAPAQSKTINAVVQQERDSNKKASSNSSSPRISSLKDALPPLPSGSERSILDFGKASPGEEMNAPSIVLHIPLVTGETNKYVNFMRMAEDRYGWDALHPRQAANRERKARIAAASAALEKTDSGRDSTNEMEEDLQSDADNSNIEMGGTANGVAGATSGPDGAPAKKPRKKRNFKEDEYDKADDFVDDSELLWEEQAAASRDGFFVYSGPLIPEVEKPVVPDGPPRRGRGGGRGSRGGRGGTTRGEGTGRGRGGGPGSRGGAVTRKPRITKLEKEQRDREKAEREKLAMMGSKGTGVQAGGYNLLQPAPSAGMAGVA
ncbi:hypothetical protein B0T19DRAFT_361828 [Cercophora scortea]|uniref:Hpc2-related domain-containing protein n=1 Tax=Cercophora scortea TaxID=314031 RepID=A0AAE0M6Q2_9PEZI|nr:hypothetical protein B0T19DRAFT_361828 [Cercophora scortea]